MTHDYVRSAVTTVMSPKGGMTRAVWVVDSTPPQMVLVGVESVNHETIQLTLQLNEPGTLWCQAAELSISALRSQYARHL